MCSLKVALEFSYLFNKEMQKIVLMETVLDDAKQTHVCKLSYNELEFLAATTAVQMFDAFKLYSQSSQIPFEGVVLEGASLEDMISVGGLINCALDLLMEGNLGESILIERLKQVPFYYGREEGNLDKGNFYRENRFYHLNVGAFGQVKANQNGKVVF